MKRKRTVRALGRPRGFDTEKALDAAMREFWRKGYEGASLANLTKAMGINRPSLYAAFGDKEALFRKVLDRYEEGPAAYVEEALSQPTARGAVERLVYGAVDMATGAAHPKGCLFRVDWRAASRRRAFGTTLFCAAMLERRLCASDCNGRGRRETCVRMLILPILLVL